MIGKVYAFCPLCSAQLKERHVELEGRVRITCVSCEFIHYQNPTPAAGVVVIENESLLLVKRKFKPRAGLWTLPAGFVESDEDVPACAAREAKEETNLDVEIERVFDVYSAFDDPRAAVVLIIYVARRVGGELAPGDDASDARFFPLADLPEDIAFRAHVNALADVKAQHAAGVL